MALHFRQATSIFAQTMPFVLLRLGVALAFGLLTLLYFGIAGGLLYALRDSVSGAIVAIAFVLTVGLFLAAIRFGKAYLLYLVSAGHIAVIAHAVDTGSVPENQIAFGKERVTGQFKEASGLFVLDKLVKSVLNQFNSAVVSFSGIVSLVPALKRIVTLLRKSITLAGRHLDQAILAHIFLNPKQSNWQSARDGLVLYAKTWRSVLASSMVLIVCMYVLTGLAMLMIAPIALLIGQFSPVLEIASWGLVFAVGAVVHFGVVAPYIKTVIVTTYLIEAEGKTPDSETMDRLESKSGKFREILDNAGSGTKRDTDRLPGKQDGAVQG